MKLRGEGLNKTRSEWQRFDKLERAVINMLWSASDRKLRGLRDGTHKTFSTVFPAQCVSDLMAALEELRPGIVEGIINVRNNTRPD